MGHDWIFEVLTDLRVYAQANGLSALALKVDETLRVAHAEISAASGAAPAPQPGSGGLPPGGKAH